MAVRNDTRRLALLLAMAIIVTAVVVPTCQMVGCTMGAMPFFGSNGLSVTAPCDGAYVVSSSPFAVVPPGATSLLLVLLASVVVAMPLLFSPVASGPVIVEVAEPPPPPTDPRGERLTV